MFKTRRAWLDRAAPLFAHQVDALAFVALIALSRPAAIGVGTPRGNGTPLSRAALTS
jgi:hypothetical protein